jgi:hypothetical protein
VQSASSFAGSNMLRPCPKSLRKPEWF